MNRWRIAGLVLLAAFAAWLVLRGCSPAPDPETSSQSATPARDKFHASRPLQVTATGNDADWLERELRYLLLRGRMQVAPVGADVRPSYSLRIEMQPKVATLKLVAPDGVVEREQGIETSTRALETMQILAKILPGFLGAAHSQGDWVALIGTGDADAYDSYIESANALLGSSGRGFTQPAVADSSPSVDRLESLTRRQPKFARAWSLLAVSYLGLGGKDEASLTQLAETTAERALALDPSLANAHSALGLVSLRRSEWVAAMDHFSTALKSDPNALAALEGLGCLLIDVGHAKAALPITQRAAALQPSNIGAAECRAYAQLASGLDVGVEGSQPLEVAVVKALDALLAGQPSIAESTLRDAQATSNAAAWSGPLLRAANNRRETPQALQAITRAANDGAIEPATEVACGAALKQSDFVFNRMLRLHKQNEAVPLRILWLPRTAFLRKHHGFQDIVSAAGLLPYWQDHGLPDVCAAESATYGCKLKPQKAAAKDE